MVFERLQASLTLDTSGFNRGVEDAKSDMDSLQQRGKDMGRSMQRVGGMMTAGITLPLVAMGAKSVQTASDIEEMQSKMNVVFGDLTGDVEDWSESHADAVNRSQYQLQEYATTLQDTFVPMGFAREEAASMSKELTELGVDLASFNNMAEDDAIRRLQSGIVGNHQALREFGVMITQSRLDEKLLEMFEVGTDKATEAQKAQARYQLIMEDTADAQGDAARTSDSYANQVRGLKADIEELQLQIGQYLLPYAKELVGIVQNLTGWFGSLSERQQKVVLAIAGVLAVAGPLLFFVGTLLAMFPAAAAGAAILAGAIGGLTLPILAVVAVLALLAAAWTGNWGDIQGKTASAVSFIRGKLGNFRDWLAGPFLSSWGDLVDGVASRWDSFKTTVGNGLDSAETRIDNFISGMFAKGQSLVNEFTDGIKSLKEKPAEIAGDIAEGIGKFWPSSPAEEGELSDLDRRGPALVHELAQGMRQNTGEAQSASSEVARAASPEPRAHTPAAAGGGDSPGVVNQFDFSGIPDDAYIQVEALKEMLLQEQKGREEREMDQLFGGVS